MGQVVNGCSRVSEGAFAMPNLIHYTCQPELVPIIEATLAAHGCILDMYHQDHNTMVRVMSQRGATILLAQPAPDAQVAIEVWGVAGGYIAGLLESLPLERQSLSLEEPFATH